MSTQEGLREALMQDFGLEPDQMPAAQLQRLQQALGRHERRKRLLRQGTAVCWGLGLLLLGLPLGIQRALRPELPGDHLGFIPDMATLAAKLRPLEVAGALVLAGALIMTCTLAYRALVRKAALARFKPTNA